MKLQDFRVGLRILAKDPVYSLVSILGLGVGLGACLLLLGYARYCWRYNAHVPDADNVYIVNQRNNLELGTPWYDQASDIAAVIVLSAVVALPLAALAIGRYLAAYTERTPLAFWALAFSLMVSSAVAAFAGARQAWIAMMLKPAVALRK